MTVWAVLPVKPLTAGKSRLHRYLRSDQIIDLNRSLFESTFERILACHVIDRLMVITKDQELLDYTRANGGVALQENTPSSLNKAVSQAFAVIQDNDPGPVLVVPADLPDMRSEDLAELIDQGTSDRFLLIVPDCHQTGTNALFASSPTLIEPRFGRRSFQKHTGQALKKSAEITIWLKKSMQYDLDTFQDLQLYNKINVQSSILTN
jgi:2-phospho-L-lactate guanylyltransferase